MTDNLQIDLSLGNGWGHTLPTAEKLCRQTAITTLLAACQHDGPMELSLALSDDATVRALNRDYRGRDSATNVLSFPHAEQAPLVGGGRPPRLLGDVILARETVVREAADLGKTVADHLCHLVVHGILHLLGYDHETSRDAAEMERMEVSILSELGIADPYAVMDQTAG